MTGCPRSAFAWQSVMGGCIRAICFHGRWRAAPARAGNLSALDSGPDPPTGIGFHNCPQAP